MKKLLMLLFALAFLIPLANAGVMTVYLTTPLNDTWASVTNNTQAFVFNYTNTTGNASATCQLFINGSTAQTVGTIANTATTIYSNLGLSTANNTWQVNCTNGSNVLSESRVLRVDRNPPKMTTTSQFNVSGLHNMSIRLQYLVNDSIGNPSNVSCYATIFDSSNVAKLNISGTVNVTTIGGDVPIACVIPINASDIASVSDGLLTINGTVVDSAGNVNVSMMVNYTKISLYSGWNAIQAMTNGTLYGVYSMLPGEITHVSWFNNSNHAYTSYVVGLSANNASKFVEGDVVYVKVNRAATLLWQNIYQTGNLSQKVYNLTTGWNQITFFNKTLNFTNAFKLNGSGTVDLLNWTATADMKAFSYYNASAGVYVSSLYSLSINKGTIIQRGWGVWVLVNETTNFVTRRV